MVQRAADLSLEPSEPVVGHRLRNGMAHTVVARTGDRTVIVRPRQDLEREVFVGLEVFDQRRTTAHIRLLEGGRRAVAHDAAVVAKGVVDGVVDARADAGRGCTGTTCRRHRSRRTYRRTGRLPRRSLPKALRVQRCTRPPARLRCRPPGRRPFLVGSWSQVPRSVDEATFPRREEPSATGFGAAVDGDVVTGDECGLIRRQEQRDTGLILGPSDPARRAPTTPTGRRRPRNRSGSRPAGSGPGRSRCR